MRIARNITLITFVIFTALLNIVLVPLWYHIQTAEQFFGGQIRQVADTIIGYLPCFCLRLFAMAALVAKRPIILILTLTIGLLPAIGCCFIKKPRIFRGIVYTAILLLVFIDIRWTFPVEMYISDILYIAWAAAIDVLNTKCIGKDKQKTINAFQETGEIA